MPDLYSFMLPTEEVFRWESTFSVLGMKKVIHCTRSYANKLTVPYWPGWYNQLIKMRNTLFFHCKVCHWHANLCCIVLSGSGFQANKGNLQNNVFSSNQKDKAGLCWLGWSRRWMISPASSFCTNRTARTARPFVMWMTMNRCSHAIRRP